MSDFIIEHWSEIVIFVAIVYNIGFVSYKFAKWKTETQAHHQSLLERLNSIERFAKEQSVKFDELDKRLYEMEKEVAILALRINGRAVT